MLTHAQKDNIPDDLTSKVLSPFNLLPKKLAREEPSGCYGRPKNCSCPEECTFRVEWRAKSKDTYSVIITGGAAEDYMAIGWPTVGGMGPTPVIVCAANGSLLGNQTTAINWNTDSLSSDPAVNSTPSDLVTLVAATVVDGQQICSLEVKATFQVAAPNGSMVGRNLNTEPYYVILATGPLQGGKIQQHTTRGHSPAAIWWSDYNSYLPFTYRGCGETVGCEGLPSNCQATRNCSVLLRYEAIAEDMYQFSLTGLTASEATYLAVGLSLDNHMGDDSVVACIPEGNVGTVMYWNLASYSSVPLPNTTVGLSNGVVNYIDGILTCSFFLKESTLSL